MRSVGLPIPVAGRQQWINSKVIHILRENYLSQEEQYTPKEVKDPCSVALSNFTNQSCVAELVYVQEKPEHGVTNT